MFPEYLKSIPLLRAAALLTLVIARPACGQFVESLLDFGALVDSAIALPGFSGLPGAVFATGRNADGEKRIALYRINDDGSVSASAISAIGVGGDILFFDQGRIGAREMVTFLTPNGLLALDPDGGGLSELVEIQSIYRSPSPAALTQLEFLRDVNRDGLDDVVVPDFDGVRVYLQQADGFSPGTLLKVAPRLRLSGRSPEYVADELYYYDFDLDGTRDLAILRDNRFLVFIWHDAGFRPNPREIPLSMPLASARDVEMFEENATDLDQSNYQLSQVFRVTDLNGDDLPDVVTFTTISSGVFDKRTEYRVYLGRRDSGGVCFAAEPDAMIPSQGFQVELVEIDANGNGRQDLVSTSLRLGLGKILKALFSRSMNLDVELRRMDDQGGYPARPDYSSKVQVSFSLSTGFVHYPAVRFGDFDGDGLIDLLLQNKDNQLAIRPGVNDGRDFGPTATRVDTILPRNGDLIQVIDADGNKRQDLLIGYGPGDPAPLMNQLRILISR